MISRLFDDGLRTFVYNSHKRAHALKFKAVTTSDGMLLHCFGPIECLRCDWTLYAHSNSENQLKRCMISNGVQYCIWVDSGYNRREYMKLPFNDHISMKRLEHSIEP